MDETQNAAELEFREKYYALRDWLYGYREYEKEVTNKLKMLDQYEATYTSVGSPVLSDMPKAKGRVGDRTSEAVIRKVELEEELEEAISERDAMKKEIKGYMKKLKKSDERTVIELRYLLRRDVPDTADIMFGDNADFLDREYTYIRKTQEIQRNAIENMVRYLDTIGKDPREML